MASAEVSGLKQCREAQRQLEEAIKGVTKTEQQLRDNAREVRSELRSCVSRQQEALRCREVWLLSQIELLEQLKAETLQQQQQQLHQLRGQFDVIFQQLQVNNSNDVNNQLSSYMDKLASLSLTPEETPDMTFHADSRSLRQAITSFGQVQSCPITAHTQRTEGGALGDWLVGARPTSFAPGNHASRKPQDWLMSPSEPKVSCPILASVDFLQAWGQLRDLEAWLLYDHTPLSRQRSSSCSSAFSIEKIDESEFAALPEEAEGEEELSDWLITPSAVATETLSDAERWWQVLKPFNDSWSPSNWLAEPSHMASSCSSCCQSVKAVEIENLGQLKCLKTPPPSGPASPVTPARALEAWLQQVVPAPQTCRANELCSSYSDCVCEENCGREALSRWLLQQDGCKENSVPVDKNGVPVDKNGVPLDKNGPPTMYHREQKQKVQAILESWLHPTNSSSPLSAWMAPDEEKAIREEHSSSSSSSSPFLCPLEPDHWVVPQQTPPPADEQEDKWLLKKRSQAQERLMLPSVCDLFSCMKVGGDKEKWLHRAAVQM